MDPAFQLALRASFVLLLASAAFHKLRDPLRFREVLAAYEILPAGIVALAAPAVAVLELGLACLAALGLVLPLTGLLLCSLLLAYAAAIEWNLRKGRTDIDCGCMGPASHVPLGRGLVARNLVLALAAALLVLPSSPRSLLWLDVLVVMMTTTTLVACWMATERLLVLAPRAAQLRRRMR